MPTPTADVLAMAARQDGVVGRAQCLAAGVTRSDLRSWMRCRLLVTVHPGVYVTHSGPLSWRQRAWAALLAVGPGVLHGPSSIRSTLGPCRSVDDRAEIVVAVPLARHPEEPDGVRVVRIRDLDARAQWQLSPPRTRLEDATLDAAAATRSELDAVAVIAEVIGSRRTTAARLAAALARRTRMRHRDLLRRLLEDVGAGACSVLEWSYLHHVERAHGLPTAERQVRASARGTVYRDAWYRRYRLVVELDGAIDHTSFADRTRDLDRDLEAAADGELTVRLGVGQLLARSCLTARTLDRLLRRRGWTGRMRRCRRCPP